MFCNMPERGKMAAEEKLLIGLEKKTEKEKICFKWSKNALKRFRNL